MTARRAVDPDELADRCLMGDHRWCTVGKCEHATRWHPTVLATALAALDRSGRRFAVMCIDAGCLDRGAPRLLATVRDGWSATGSRNSHWKRCHNGYARPLGMYELKGVVYVVDAEPELRIR